MNQYERPKRYLRIREASDEYNVSVPLLRKLIAKGRVAAVRPAGARVVLIARESLEQLMAVGTFTGTPKVR